MANGFKPSEYEYRIDAVNLPRLELLSKKVPDLLEVKIGNKLRLKKIGTIATKCYAKVNYLDNQFNTITINSLVDDIVLFGGVKL